MKKRMLKAASVSLDLEKAFDSVRRYGLQLNLWIAGIRGHLFSLLQTFLKNRLVRTQLEGQLSHQVQPEQVVPQGSVLSPSLFNFNIAEMLKNTTTIIFKYSYDWQIIASAPTESSLHRILQRNLNFVEKWCSTCRIQINGTKTEIVPINSDGRTTPNFKLQTRFYPNAIAAEVILGMPPIDIICQNISAKFLIKVLQLRDLLSELIIQIERAVNFVTIHRNILKPFYNQKTLDLTDSLN